MGLLFAEPYDPDRWRVAQEWAAARDRADKEFYERVAAMLGREIAMPGARLVWVNPHPPRRELRYR